MSFIGMKLFGVDANIVALSGIAIAIGTMVDMGVILSENMVRHLQGADPEENRLEVIYRAASEVGGAVVTAVATTVVSFLPVFTMEAAEGKLFKPLAYTKTFALVSSLVLALTLMPAVAHLFMGRRLGRGIPIPSRWRSTMSRWSLVITVVVVGLVLTTSWLPLGPEKGVLVNALFIFAIIGGILGFFAMVIRNYEALLSWCLQHKLAFLSAPVVLVILAGTIWLGVDGLTGWLPQPVRTSPPLAALSRAFPGLGKEFMPDLDEGSFLYMPTTMPHASIGEALDVLAKLDMAIQSIPEVESVVGKLGRADTSLDPAPISMIETVINYKSEYRLNEHGRRIRFRHRNGEYARDDQGELIPDRRGRPYRQWRPEIGSSNDIWDQIVKAADLLGTHIGPTSATHRGPNRHAPERHACAHGGSRSRGPTCRPSTTWGSTWRGFSRAFRRWNPHRYSPTASSASRTSRSTSTGRRLPAMGSTSRAFRM